MIFRFIPLTNDVSQSRDLLLLKQIYISNFLVRKTCFLLFNQFYIMNNYLYTIKSYHQCRRGQPMTEIRRTNFYHIQLKIILTLYCTGYD